MSYGGRGEIIDAVKAMILAGTGPDEVSEETLRPFLYWPDITGGPTGRGHRSSPAGPNRRLAPPQPP